MAKVPNGEETNKQTNRRQSDERRTGNSVRTGGEVTREFTLAKNEITIFRLI